MATYKKASAYRLRMISNPPSIYRKAIRTRAGSQVAKLFKRFHGVAVPPSIKTIKGGGKKTIPLVGMGYARAMHLSTSQKGKRGRKRIVRGHWTVAVDGSGKQVMLLSGRPLIGKLVRVGFAPETHYTPTPDLEAAGTSKKGFEWRHVHGRDDKNRGVDSKRLPWPPVFADRNGKVDGKSNFVYGKTPIARVSDWMYG